MGLEGSGSNRRIRAVEPNDDVEAGYGRTVVVIVVAVRVRDNKITIRPIAGTRPRGRNFKEDNKLQKELLNDKKEISEHLMLLDLGRNDVGKVSKIGSVKVDQKFKIEK